MFWWIVLAVVVVVGFAVAWWTSGRAKGRLRQINPENDPGVARGKAAVERDQIRGTFGPFN